MILRGLPSTLRRKGSPLYCMNPINSMGDSVEAYLDTYLEADRLGDKIYPRNFSALRI